MSFVPATLSLQFLFPLDILLLFNVGELVNRGIRLARGAAVGYESEPNGPPMQSTGPRRAGSPATTIASIAALTASGRPGQQPTIRANSGSHVLGVATKLERSGVDRSFSRVSASSPSPVPPIFLSHGLGALEPLRWARFYTTQTGG